MAVGAKHAVVMETIFAQMLCLPTCRSRLVAYGQLLVRICLSRHLAPDCSKQVAGDQLQSATACPACPGWLAVGRRHARQCSLTTAPPPPRLKSCCLQLNLCHLDRTFPKPLTGCVKALMHHMPVSGGTSAIRLHAGRASTSRDLHLGTAIKTHTATEPLCCCCRALMLSCACGWQSGSVSMSAMEISTGPGPAGPMWQTSLATTPAGGQHCICTLQVIWCSSDACHSSTCCMLATLDYTATPSWLLAGNSNAPDSKAANWMPAHSNTASSCSALTAASFQAFQASLLCWCRQFVALALEYLSRLSYPTYLTSEHSQVGAQVYLFV